MSVTRAALAGLALASCIGAKAEPQTASTEEAHNPVTADRGAAVYADACASCHGPGGEGQGDAPALVGKGTLPEYGRDALAGNSFTFHDPQQQEVEQATRSAQQAVRGRFHAAQDLFDYVTLHDHDVRLQLAPEDVWTVVTLLIAQHGWPIPHGGIDANNAPSVKLGPR